MARVTGCPARMRTVDETKPYIWIEPTRPPADSSREFGDTAGATTTALVLTQIGGGVAQTVTSPFTSGVRALLYVDRRMRAEGLDVALAAAATG